MKIEKTPVPLEPISFEKRDRSHHDASRWMKSHFTLETDNSSYLATILNKEAESERVMYIHIPYCKKHCSFCLFNKPSEFSIHNYHEFVIQQLQRQSVFAYMKKPLSSIYFGGGTPTSLKPEQMAAILQEIRCNYNLKTDCEISVESTTSELHPEMLAALVENGVNRFSIGIQTFDPVGRTLFNRKADAQDAIDTLKRVRSVVQNVNIDLIYHYPGQTQEALKNDLNIIKSLDLAGLSIYALTIHENAPLAKKLNTAQKRELSDIQLEWSRFEYITNTLLDDGFSFFEASKMVKDNRDTYRYVAVRHAEGDCIAIGLGAGGNIANYLYRNHNIGYQEFSDTLPFSTMGRVTNPDYKIYDKLINDLEQNSLNWKDFSDKLNFDLEKHLEPLLEQFETQGFGKTANGVFSLSLKGIFWSNNIIRAISQYILLQKSKNIIDKI